MLQAEFRTTEISSINILKEWRKFFLKKEFGIMIYMEKQNVERTITR